MSQIKNRSAKMISILCLSLKLIQREHELQILQLFIRSNFDNLNLSLTSTLELTEN